MAFTSIAGAQQAAQTYAIVNPLDIYQTEIAKKLTRRVPHMSSLSWLKHVKGRMAKRKVKRSTYSFYEEGQFMKAAATIAAIAPSGAKFLVTLSAADHGSIGGAGKSSFPVKNMLVMFQDGKTAGFVESIDRSVDSAHVLTVSKQTTAMDISTIGTVGSTIMFYSNGQPEASTKTEGRVPVFEKVTNFMHTIREYFDTTDIEAQNITWFEIDGKPYLWYKTMEETAQRFEFQKEAAMLIGPQSASLVDAAGKAVQTMNGFFPQIDSNGTTIEYFGKMDGATMDETMLAMDNAYGDKEYIGGLGHNVMLGLKDYLVEFGQNGTGMISFSPFDGGQEQAIKLNFKYYSVGAYTFYFNQWDILSHRDSLGANGLPYRFWGGFIPAGTTRNVDPDRSEGSPDYEPYMQMTTPQWGFALNPNIVKGEDLMWEDGAFATQGATSDVAKRQVHMMSYLALEMRCRNKFFKVEPS